VPPGQTTSIPNYGNFLVEDSKVPMIHRGLEEMRQGQFDGWHFILQYFSETRLYSVNYRIFFPEGGVGQTQAWLPAYASILCIPQMI
jgi:hypothetical protein